MKKVGIIGCGNIAQVHGWVLHSMEQVELVAVCDTDTEKAHALSEKYTDGKAKVFTDWQELCLAEVDVVHVCTPHFLHAFMASELLKHGKTVFVEKPCAISLEQFEELKQAEKSSLGKLGFCFQNRYNETTLAIDKMVEKGLIGEVRGARAFVTWQRDEDYYAGSNWKGNWVTEGGGVLMNQAIHTLDLLLHYLGEPLQIAGTMANHHLQGCIEMEDTVEAWMSFKGNKRACFYASNAYVTDAPVILELQGEKGRIIMNGSEISLWLPEEGVQHFTYEQKSGIGKGYWGCGHQACIGDFYDCLEREVDFQADIEGAENTFQTLMKIYEVAGWLNNIK